MEVLRASRFLLTLGYRLDRRRLAIAIAVMLAGYAAAPLAALALATLVRDLLGEHPRSTVGLALLAAALLAAQLMGNHFAHQCYGRLYEHERAAVGVDLISIVTALPGIEHHDDPEYADRLAIVRSTVAVATTALESLLNLLGLLVQTIITIAILISIEPMLAVFPLFVIPPVLLSRHAQILLEWARERGAEQVRLSEHLLDIATAETTAMQIRMFGAEGEILQRQRTAWTAVSRLMWRAHVRSAGLRALGQLAFTVGYGGAVLLIVDQGLRGQATAEGLILVVTLALQVNLQVSAALGQLAGLQLTGHFVERLNWLRRYQAGHRPTPDAGATVCPTPRRLARGITLDGVSFVYPGTDVRVLNDVSVHLPAGHSVALVGENGAGKSTFAKLLCGLYSPTEGRILVDGVDLAEMDPAEWRNRVATLFQNYVNIELTLRESVGLGEVERIDDEPAVRRAVSDADAEELLRSLPDGLDAVLGRGYRPGSELSGGQWQRVALARSLMRPQPLLLILDEPAAALDAAAEHLLFERYSASSRLAADRTGGVTLLISHRFSTVSMADTIVVLDGGRLRDHGSHEELLAHGGLYSELYRLQARAYR
jgi:ATP-binding cassette, subfamily B, bacterial